jgi:hypothetical protein
MRCYIITRHYDAYSKVIAVTTNIRIADTVIVEDLMKDDNISIASKSFYENEFLSSEDYDNIEDYRADLMNYLYQKLEINVNYFEKFYEVITAPIILD